MGRGAGQCHFLVRFKNGPRRGAVRQWAFGGGRGRANDFHPSGGISLFRESLRQATRRRFRPLLVLEAGQNRGARVSGDGLGRSSSGAGCYRLLAPPGRAESGNGSGKTAAGQGAGGRTGGAAVLTISRSIRVSANSLHRMVNSASRSATQRLARATFGDPPRLDGAPPSSSVPFRGVRRTAATSSLRPRVRSGFAASSRPKNPRISPLPLTLAAEPSKAIWSSRLSPSPSSLTPALSTGDWALPGRRAGRKRHRWALLSPSGVVEIGHFPTGALARIGL